MDQTVRRDVMQVVDAVQLLHPQLVFGIDAELPGGQVRMHFAGYDEESNAFRPFAGLAAARRQWSKAPEPTVIFGFESEEFLKRSDDAVILEREGVAWLPYTSTFDEIRQAIEIVLRASPANNDQRIDQLSEEDFNRELQNFGHVFKPNIINSLTIRRHDLVSTNPETRECQYRILMGKKQDYLCSRKKEFERLVGKYEGMQFTRQYKVELEKVRQWLDNADCEWTAMLALAQAPFSDDVVCAVDAKLVDIITTLERMYAMTCEIRSRLNQREQA